MVKGSLDFQEEEATKSKEAESKEAAKHGRFWSGEREYYSLAIPRIYLSDVNSCFSLIRFLFIGEQQ